MEIENKLLMYQMEKEKKQHNEKLTKIQNELNNYKKEKNSYLKKEDIYKNEINLKQKEINKLQAKIRVLNTNSNFNNVKDNNVSNLTMLIKSKMNSTFCTVSKDEQEHEFYFNKNQNGDNLIKNKTMSNIKPSRNNSNYFTNKPIHKININNLNSQQNTIFNINPYIQKNFSSNSLRKNSSNSNQRKTTINSNNKRRQKRLISNNNNNNSSLSITNNTFNMNKNNILINVNPKNMSNNMNLEKLKVQKRLYEYQKLIDQKLNELMRNRNAYQKSNKNKIYMKRSPIYSHSKKKSNNSVNSVEYLVKKNKKKSITPNTNILFNNQNVMKQQIIRSTISSIGDRKTSKKNNNKNKKNNIYVNNIKQKLYKSTFNTIKNEDKNDSGKINLSLRKFIFTNNSSSSSKIKKKFK